MKQVQVEGEVRTILADLVAIDSVYPPGITTAVMTYAADRLRRAGYAVDTVANVPGLDNVIARLGGGTPSIVFNVHADTVGVSDRSAWRTDPFVATLQSGRVYGLGAGNCKGAMRRRFGRPKRSRTKAGRVTVKWSSLLSVTKRASVPTAWRGCAQAAG